MLVSHFCDQIPDRSITGLFGSGLILQPMCWEQDMASLFAFAVGEKRHECTRPMASSWLCNFGFLTTSQGVYPMITVHCGLSKPSLTLTPHKFEIVSSFYFYPLSHIHSIICQIFHTQHKRTKFHFIPYLERIYILLVLVIPFLWLSNSQPQHPSFQLPHRITYEPHRITKEITLALLSTYSQKLVLSPLSSNSWTQVVGWLLFVIDQISAFVLQWYLVSSCWPQFNQLCD